ncbi:Nuclear envelope morphology protein 1 [Orbilia blumenaviensis]|uniref:Nuclear envelope morphology protein 1 n=1 Tax=Orbilia blumenaviensis TaxID=1796055 RepID=A0AAV9U9U3_9PEZI
MNSLNLLSSQVDRVIGTTPPSTPRSEASFKSEFFPSLLEKGDLSLPEAAEDPSSFEDEPSESQQNKQDDGEEEESETTALLPKSGSESGSGGYDSDSSSSGQSIASSAPTPVTKLWRTLRASISWVVSCFYDHNHQFSFLAPVQRVALFLIRPFGARRYELSPFQEHHQRQSYTDASHSSDSDEPGTVDEKASPSSSSSSLLPPPADEIAPRRSIRIRLFSSEKQQKAKSMKSPTSPSASLRLTRYPRLSGPPRPLLPKSPQQKTLILDLDETLIHSMSKGGSMSAAHMVEVKLDKQHAILYYVHKRPFCDEFLKKVCKWYNVVIFTASVQEYADPVIDWLDQEHKYFRARYYRQHCTYRDGVYIKDLSVVEPDLSKVMIVDNSPTSYIFHKDNAIPIEGWISDPSDHHLLHLIPILQGLQYVTDVRAFLALRMGEAVT